MIKKSLRFRITVVTVLFTGILLSIFLWLGWRNLKVQRHREVDPILTPLVLKSCMQLSSPSDWKRVLPQIQSTFSYDITEENHAHILLVDHTQPKIIFYNSQELLGVMSLDNYMPSQQIIDNFTSIQSPPLETAKLEPIIYIPDITTLAINGVPHRLVSCSNPRYTLIVAAGTEHINAPIQRTLDLTILAAPIFVLIVGSLTWLLIAHALFPLKNIASTSRKIIEGSLNERVELKGTESSEIIDVVQIINEMIDRMERNYHQASRFSSDASHELKSPLAALQGTLELALQKTEDLPVMQDAVITAYDETQKLKQIIQALLMLTRIDSGSIEANIKYSNISELCENLCEDTQILAEDSNITFNQEIPPNIYSNLDPTLLRQVLNNLLTNAVKYNKAEGQITCRLFSQLETTYIEVENTGPIIPEDSRENIFKRFVRLDKARSQKNIKGFGLGLNIANELSRINDCKLELTKSSNGINIFRISLPKKGRNTSPRATSIK